MSAGTIGQRFDPRANALNFLRLCLALEVLGWHAYALRGSTWLPDQVETFLADIAVDGFFAISGFLICRSWQTHPHLGRFLLARARRILPAFWVCLIMTAFVIAPITAWLSGTSTPSVSGRVSYVASNAGLWIHSWGIDGGPSWNGSLWSLGLEAVCYLAVAVLGICWLLRTVTMSTVAAVLWLLGAALTLDGFTDTNSINVAVARCGLMFASGALVWMMRDRIRFDRRLALIALASIPAGLLMAPGDYRLVASPGIAYLTIWSGIVLGHHPRLTLSNDLSYGTYVYGYPVQRLLLGAGISLGWGWFTLVSVAIVLPIAALSWFTVERPLLGRRRRSGGDAKPNRVHLADRAAEVAA